MVVLIGKAKQNVICPLCLEETKEEVMVWADSFTGYAHRSCMDIALNVIPIYSKWAVYFIKKLTDIKMEIKEVSVDSSHN